MYLLSQYYYYYCYYYYCYCYYCKCRHQHDFLSHFLHYKLFFASSRGAKYCNQRVCLYICLFVHLYRPYLKTKLHEIFCTC